MNDTLFAVMVACVVVLAMIGAGYVVVELFEVTCS